MNKTNNQDSNSINHYDYSISQLINSSNNNNKSTKLPDIKHDNTKHNDTIQKSINSKRNRTIQENAPTKYESFIKESCKNFNLDWLNAEFDFLIYRIDNTIKAHDFSTSNKQIPELKEVLKLMVSNGMFTRSIDVKNQLNMPRRTAQKYLLNLCKLRWCMKGRWVSYNDINPFLQMLFYLSPKNSGLFIKKYAPKQIDVLDLFAYPLFEAFNEKVNDVKFIWSQKEPSFDKHYFPSTIYSVKFYPYFNGTVQIKAETDNQDYYVTLPYNIHWTGRNKHVTLPIPFKFYGVQECGYSTNESLKVHFDNSITVSIPLGSASYTTKQLLKQWNMPHWSDMANRFMHKYWKNEYVECFDFKTHEEIIKNRLFYKAIPIKQVEEKTFLLKQLLAQI